MNDETDERATWADVRRYVEYIKGQMAMTSIPAPSTYCYSSFSATGELGAHVHVMPDGAYSPMHFHPGGNVPHSHVVMHFHPCGSNAAYWDFDYNACPELCTNVASASITIGATPDAVAVDPDSVYYGGGDPRIEPPVAKQPKADVIWELLKGACAK